MTRSANTALDRLMAAEKPGFRAVEGAAGPFVTSSHAEPTVARGVL
ncbi:hypothetical protein [Streptomyces sp. ATCC 21386]|nr:hypothetical protein [Streptomyces sp. ATCC 21386]